jgi:hypothetical protein
MILAFSVLFQKGASGALFYPGSSFLQGVSTDETANFGLAGTLNSITPNGQAVDYNVTFGSGSSGVGVDATFFGPSLNLSAFTGTAVQVSVVSGGPVQVDLFVQDGVSGQYNWVENWSSWLAVGSGVTQLTLDFSTPAYGTGNALDSGDLIRYGFKIIGSPGNSATVEFSPVPAPEPSTWLAGMAALGLAGFVHVRRPAE